MNTKVLVIIILLALTVIGLGYLYQTVPKDLVVVTMKKQDGTELGTIKMGETKAGVLLTLNLQGLEPNGVHAIHIHETGECEGNFTSAGGHYNPDGKAHGMKHPEGKHAGDMPNLEPDENGNIETQILNQQITLFDQNFAGRATVYDEDGSVIIIHEGQDDHMSQPSGAAGPRMACGLIERVNAE